MAARMILGSILMMCVLAIPAHAGGKEDLQKYFNDTATKVKATESPAGKRDILNSSFRNISRALDIVQSSPAISQDESAGIDHYKAALQEKQDELAGNNGFAAVPDAQLDAFADYVVQDMEQADAVITISVVTLLLIAILIILLVK